MGNKDGTVVRAIASHQCGSRSIARLGVRVCAVEFVVGPRPCSKRFFSEYSGFPISSSEGSTLR